MAAHACLNFTSCTCDKDDPNNKLWIIQYTLSTYNVVNNVIYFALIFKLVETPGGGGGGVFDIIIHTYGVDHFEVQKNQYFWGYEEIVDIFGWSLDRTSNLGLISIHLVFFFS